MAIEIQPEQAEQPGGPGPGGPARARSWWMRPAIHTGVGGGVVGYFVGHWLGNFLAGGYTQVVNSGMNNMAIVLGYVIGTVGFLAGMGVFNDLLRQMAGRPVHSAEETAEAASGLARFFRYSLGHKVVGIQYLVGMIVYFLTGGLLAMAIRTELLSPSYHVFSSATYIEIVGEHGTMMIMMMSSLILGPFGNYLIPLNIQATQGADSYAVAFALMGLSLILLGFNVIVTVICYRAPGMRWSRIPIFVWAMVTTAFLMVLAAPVLVGGMYMMITDRTVQTAFFTDDLGGSSYLYQNLFWFFGHPEVYILALPGFGIVSEILPVFCRKPLFGYRVAAAGMVGVTLLSFFVWQHHLFDSGINPDMRPLFMLTTELISIPTGFIFLVAMGTLWKAKIRFTVPMLFALGMYFNFLIGGISGVFLSDVPADTTSHGSFFVMAHFHYTIMGGLIFAFMGGIYYWLPKMLGIRLNETLGKIHFWTMFIFFNATFLPLFAVGLLGQPRRVYTYARDLETLNDWVSISSFLLGVSFLIFVFNFVMSTAVWRRREVGNPWQSRGLEWQVSSPPPAGNFTHVPVVLSAPYDYGEKDAQPVADLDPPPGVLSAAYAGAGAGT